LGNFIAQAFNFIYFDEYAHDISGVGILPEQENRLPILFSFIETKILKRE
tara:strand:+ start:600 stop:749 length:150 start_codon:yes stop_codon:yes gene_type:complete